MRQRKMPRVVGVDDTNQILNSLEQLDEQFTRLVLAQLLLHHDKVEQLTLCGELENEVNAVAFIECVLQAQYVGVAHAHQNSNLLLQALCL